LVLPLASAEAEAFFAVCAARPGPLSRRAEAVAATSIAARAPAGWREAVARASAIPFVQRLRAKRAARASATNDGYRFAAAPRCPTCRPIAAMQCLLHQQEGNNAVVVLRGRFAREPAHGGRTFWETIA